MSARDRVCRLLAFGLAAVAQADCAVVFNEVMYHPAQADEAPFEWVELRNQLAVDVELSGWSIGGGIDYSFPEGTVIPGRGYLVVAGDPASLSAAGVTNACGPFSGRLANEGETLELRNNNRRLMDALTYGADASWPAAPGGAGLSLAKRDEDAATADPSNWQASLVIGGTPGAPNTPEVSVSAEPEALRLDACWRYLADGSEPGSGWAQPGFDDRAWPEGQGVFYAATTASGLAVTQTIASLFPSGLNDARQVLAVGLTDPHYALTASAYSTPPPPDIGATVMANHSAWLANNATSRWIGAVASGTASVPGGSYVYRTAFDLSGLQPDTAQLSLRVAVDNRLTNVFLNGSSQNITLIGFSSFSAWVAVTNGFSPGANTLDFCTVNDSAGPAGFRVEASGTAVTCVPTNTPLAATQATKYFRATFVLAGDPGAAALQLRAAVDDGAVFYLNGAEVLRLNLPAGPISHTTASSTNVIRAVLSPPFSLPTDALVSGTNVLAAEVHQAASGSNDLLFGATLSLSVTNGLLPRVPPLAFNELCGTGQTFWAELINTGAEDVCLSNAVLKRLGPVEQELLLPPLTLPAGGRTVLDSAALGFAAEAGDRLALFTPGLKAVVDAAFITGEPQARWPEGTGAWRSPASPTPGASNQVSLCGDVVINEIMYHPRDPQGPSVASPEQWIELFNRGTATVDLANWRLDVDRHTAFTFPAGQTLASGAYLVVASDAAALRERLPAAAVAGDLTRRLPGKGGLLELFDAAGNPANAVAYGDSLPWPSYADGLGASLELRDPRADNARPEAWAASDERAKAAWQTVSYRGTATVEKASSPTLWKEFVLGLIGEGEVLLDDVSVVQQPDGEARQLIQNGSFETGTNAWRIIGNHRCSEVADDPDEAGNAVLRLVSDGYTEHMHNHAETTLADGAAVTTGMVYEISFRAKWVAGCNRLLTRLYFNRLPRLTELAAPAQTGTPGARNSVYAANLGPTFRNLSHAPAVPEGGQAVTVSVAASDPDGVATGVLHYAVNSGGWQALPMALSGAGGEAALRATVPGQAAGSIVQFYVEASDGLGATSFSPAGGPDSRALFEVSDGTAVMPRLRTVRIITTPADTTNLHSLVNVMSNGRTGCTLITDERTVAYDAGLHLQGSERGRPAASRVGFTVRLPSDRPYRGVLDGFTVDRSGGYSGLGGDPDEILLKHAVNKAGGLPGMYDDLCQVFAPRASDDGIALLLLAKYGSEFLDSQYADGGDGELFKFEYIYYPTNTLTGDPQSPKLPTPDLVLGTDIKDLGSDPEAYRWTFLKENHTARNNYAPMVALAQAFSLSGAALDARMQALMDTDEWMRGIAFLGLIGNADIFTYGNHNAIFYFPPEDGKALFFLWDMDYAFCQPTNAVFPGTASANTTKLINRPQNLHAYYGHLCDLAGITGDSAYMGRWAAHYGGLVGQNWGGIATYLKNRASYVLGMLPLSVPFAITNNAGSAFSVTNSPVTLAGTGAATVRSITVNGIDYPVTWTSATNWTLTVSLADVTNLLSLQAYDMRGQALANGSGSITVFNLGLLAPQPVVINEWMADNSGPGGFPDPADAKYQDWLELFNPNALSVDLSGYTLTDDLSTPAKWVIPANTVIAPRGFLLVWADDEPEQNASAPDGALHAAFKLSNSGESLALFSPQGVLQHGLTFSPQIQNVSQGYFPDGDTRAVFGMLDWTPGASNRIRSPQPPDALSFSAPASNGVAFTAQTSPGRAYELQYKDSLMDPAWRPLSTNRATSELSTFTDPATGVTQRFYRAILLQ